MLMGYFIKKYLPNRDKIVEERCYAIRGTFVSIQTFMINTFTSNLSGTSSPVPKYLKKLYLYVFRPTKLGPGPLGPFFCNNTWHFDFAKLAPIQKELDSKWTNIENGTAEDSLWKHEWQKHGTCAAQLSPLSSELKYFSKGIEFFDLHDMSGILAQSGIMPTSSKTYNVKEISNAVKAVLDKDIGVECWKDPVSKPTQNYDHGKFMLMWIIFYFRKLKSPTYLKSESATINSWFLLTAMESRRAPTATAI